MNKKTYDYSLAAGLAMVASGTLALCGWAVALLVTGALVIGLTLLGAAFTSNK